MSRVRIAYIIHQEYRWQAFEWVARYLDRDRFDPCFVLLHNGDAPHARYLRALGVDVEIIPFAGRRDLPRAIGRLHRLLRRRQIDLVHAHFINAGLTGLSAARLAGLRGVYTRHHAGPTAWHPRSRIGLRVDKLINRLSDRIIAPSALVERALVELDRISADKVARVAHGFDLETFVELDPARVESVRRRHGLYGPGPFVGVVARYLELKGHKYVIEAFARLLTRYPDVTLVLANARGRHASRIRACLRMLPSRNVVEIAFEDDIAAVFALLDLFIHVPLEDCEAFGQVYVEALAAGVPSIFTATGIAAEFVEHGREAWLVDFCNSEQIFVGARTLLADAALRESLVDGGRRAVTERFGIARHVRSLEELYLGLVLGRVQTRRFRRAQPPRPHPHRRN